MYKIEAGYSRIPVKKVKTLRLFYPQCFFFGKKSID